MTPQNFDINSLKVSSPCPASWENMSGDDRKRFCSSCELSVYNVAGMTEDEVLRVVASSEGRVCMRLRRRPDGTIITQDCRAVRKRVGVIAGAAMTAVFGLFSVTFGQKAIDPTQPEPGITMSRTISDQDTNVITGKVVDGAGNGLAGATVQLIDVATMQEKMSVQSDKEGVFRIEQIVSGKYLLQIDAPGFGIRQINDLEISKSEKIEVNIELRLEHITGLVLLPIFPTIDLKTSGPTIRKLTREDLDRIPGGRPF